MEPVRSRVVRLLMAWWRLCQLDHLVPDCLHWGAVHCHGEKLLFLEPALDLILKLKLL